ncbi:NAD-dependent protein deacylase [Hahella sp. CCB-MM4]|uniref:SIR2 family NAD-dependent protein deacylase n=1 Tax=Hahella sp. (strain CCB-MM4) TaxID=1926491 RepID=UPI000B9A29A6|nr:NAD-dependent deacylase [Hahella sp. CCB-MM4]OZG73294.1 NAD-dependent protein deacylase [Hahella sp. CCB-MM4]
MQHIVILSGSGISAESGLPTFRDVGGLWQQYSVYDLASPDGWQANPALVLDFYNARRQQACQAQPNLAHRALAALEQNFKVSVITQNIDDLHERAGSNSVLHLHGEINKARSTSNPDLIYPLEGRNIQMGDTCEEGSQLRPHVVWFGEMVPEMERAAEICRQADHFLIVGTSLQVYPAAALIHDVPPGVPVTVIDPSEDLSVSGAHIIRKTACEGVPIWAAHLHDDTTD